MARSPNERIKWFLANPPGEARQCLRHTWIATDIPALGCANANAGIAKVKEAGEMRQGPPPRGAWCWWTSSTDGHAALSLGDGRIASVDVQGAGSVGIVALTFPVDVWTQKYEGWSDYYGVKFDVGGDEDDERLTDDEIDEIAKAIWQHELADSSTGSGAKTRPATWYVNNVLDKMKLADPKRRRG